MERQLLQEGEYVQVETNNIDMEKCVTEAIEQTIEEFKDRYPLSSDMNVMFNTKKKSLEADMDPRKNTMMTTLDQKVQGLSTSLIATKVAHEKILKTIK